MNQNRNIGWSIRLIAVIGTLVPSGMRAAIAAPPEVSRQYYVSPAGDDKTDGLSPATAWRTAGKVNASQFSPGDTILFQRGGDWHEQLIASSNGTPENPITFGDYGDDNAPKPTFWGSDIIPPSAFTANSGSVYTFPVSTLPTGKAYWVFADHKFLAAASSATNMPEHSFFVSGALIHLNTGGVDPRSGSTVYTATDRAQGTEPQSSLICSNAHDNLVIRNLIGRETASVGIVTGDGAPDAYVFRVQASSNVRLENCEAYNGGKHHIGVINSTGFVGTKLYAAGCVPGLSYGHAGAFVSFSDETRKGDTSEWIDCKVDHFDPSQQSFITHGPGLGSLLIQNLTSIGCGLGIGQDNPAERIVIKGGLLAGPTCDVYGSHVLIDGLRISGDAKLDLFGNENTVQNCIDDGSTNEQGGIVVRGKDNVIRFNTLAHKGNGPCISVKSSATRVRIVGNLFTRAPRTLINDGTAELSEDYNFFDAAAGVPIGLDKDTHLVRSDPRFVDATAGDFSLRAGSGAIDLVPSASVDGLSSDYHGNPRPIGRGYDAGAYEASPK